MKTHYTFKCGALLCSFWAIFCCSPTLFAQRLQVQAHIGANFDEASFPSDQFKTEDSFVFHDSIPVNLGLSVNVRVLKHLYVRGEAHLWAARTNYHLTMTNQGSAPPFYLGNLYNEKINLLILPEFRFFALKLDKFKLPVYAFAGPSLSMEYKKNYAETYTFDTGFYEIHTTQNDPENPLGWTAGIGINPTWKRLGVLAEFRYGRRSANDENFWIPNVKYEVSEFLFGLTYNLIAD